MSDWINVNDRLPDFDEFVLWFTSDHNMFVEHLDKDAHVWLTIRAMKITHWRPLPEPPKQNDSGTKRELNGN